ncbi:RusA family crossover junction endodeoxyribonuclease [Mobiluncus mulieris]|uniref:RusA family crossover junction endodeoxyribonuclease n=1 Tax=Mobiluncus mulieris TaxID=2052 RepID=A0A7Y0Y5H9_9ACTO|nr:RusA family crossover junction endodeoxyribonuclease [Mobiluncus mulieris]NMW66004.1 RusA family crossover junction endodeoxyribonuclease [Mobiluncus mulieris]
MSDAIQMFVPGEPTPEGSTKAYIVGGKPVISHVNSAKLETWRDTITLLTTTLARKAGWKIPLDEPVKIYVKFLLQPPARPRFSTPAVKPDLDKLQRAVGDGLCPKGGGGVLKDDSRIIEWHAWKQYAERHGQTGALIRIEKMKVKADV